MKKIIATLTVIVAAALGAQGQTNTNTFPAAASVSFTNLTFASNNVTLTGGTNFTRARLLFGVTGVNFNDGDATFSAISLSGDGITGERTGFSSATASDNLLNVGDLLSYSSSGFRTLTTPINNWQAANNLVSFTVTFGNGASIPAGGQIFYRVQYADASGANLNTSFGNVNLVAVPETSTYIAAVGLLGLCLWSARRQLFKLAGPRSTSSGAGSNGAA